MKGRKGRGAITWHKLLTGSKLVSTVWSEVISAVTPQEAGVTAEMNLADEFSDVQILDAMRLKTSSLRSFPICYLSPTRLLAALICGTSYCSSVGQFRSHAGVPADDRSANSECQTAHFRS